MNRRCKRCEVLQNINRMRWSTVFRGFVCIDREQCTKNTYLIDKNNENRLENRVCD